MTTDNITYMRVVTFYERLVVFVKFISDNIPPEFMPEKKSHSCEEKT
jgi:hypothetical protein